MNQAITVETTINAPLVKVWKLWTGPQHIMQWNNASENWRTPRAEVDLREGGSFFFRMETIDGGDGFDHAGTYSKIVGQSLIEYTTAEGRKSIISFVGDEHQTRLIETFEPAQDISFDMQRDFVQSILKSFKSYAEK